MNEWFIQKWRVKDLRLNRLITYREGRESSYFTSWNRQPSLDVPKFPASPLGHCWRWSALSNGGSLSEVLTGVKERGRDHQPKKPYFRRNSASWPSKFWPGFPICSSEIMFLGSRPSFTWSETRSQCHIGRMHSRIKIHAWLSVFAKVRKIIDLIEGLYLFLHTVIHRGFGYWQPRPREPPARQ